jgi:hypothetical protein
MEEVKKSHLCSQSVVSTRRKRHAHGDTTIDGVHRPKVQVVACFPDTDRAVAASRCACYNVGIRVSPRCSSGALRLA